MRKLPTRQVHLDFHTAPWIDGVGEKFDKTQFQKALQLGRINSMTVFAKCHHGYCYYPTQVGTPHPGMAAGRDFTREMMEACHEIGVRAPLYLPIEWSALDAQAHPEWIMRDENGCLRDKNLDVTQPPEAPRPECSWFRLCSGGGYREHLFALTEEICRRYECLDGLFFDITLLGEACYCDDCRAGMKRQGLDVSNPEDAKAYYQQQKKITMEGLVAILKRHHPQATIFFNSGGADILKPQWHHLSTHYEMEDLPTVWGGYDKLPLRARYFGSTGKEFLGMTGKFHRGWGEFGGYKTPEALTFECASMLSNGVGISIGDQLHPSGAVDMATYENIGKAYAYVEQVEQYCFGNRETARLGVMVSWNKDVNDGMTRLLLDCHADFDVVRQSEDLSRFDTVILPDRLRIGEDFREALDAFLANGGKLLLLGGSGLRPDREEFAINIPFTYEGKSEYDMDYFQLIHPVPDILSSPILCYTAAHRVSGEGVVHANVREPYFSRTYGKYCSHYNTPYREETAAYPAAVQKDNILYVAHELAWLYGQYGAEYHRRYFRFLLEQLYRAECVRVELPTQGRIHLVENSEKKRYILHLLYGPPIQRGHVSVVEDFPVLYQIPVKLRVPRMPSRAACVPQGQIIPLKQEGDWITFRVPELKGHQIIQLEYR